MSSIINLAMTRTSGDGMEQEPSSKAENCNVAPKNTTLKVEHTYKKEIPERRESESKKPIKIPGKDTIYRPEFDESVSLPAVIPKGKLVLLIPRLVHRKDKSQSTTNREPRFIPFEPYKAAVKPIVPVKHKKMPRPNKNQLDINVLVEQMSNMKTSELKLNEGPNNDLETTKTVFEEEKETLQKEIEELKKQQDRTTAQLKFQVQVNSELKNLLVAAVGEDLQTRVNVLTEDKLQLARALLDTANNLSTHTEQIEYLAGQSEVWRSKFLASSVMVEELARWKADLSHKNTLLTKSNKQMLQLVSQTRNMIIDILRNLKFLARIRTLNIPTSNISDLSAECLNILQQLVLHSGIGMPENLDLDSLDSLTEAEKLAAQALENSSQHLISTDEAFKAIVEQAFHPNRSMYKIETSSNDGVTDNEHP